MRGLGNGLELRERRAEKGITAVGTRKAGKGVRAKDLQGGWSRQRSGRAEMCR